MKKLLVLLFISFLISLPSVSRARDFYHKSVPLLHTYVEIKAYGDNKTAAVIDQILSEMARVNDLLNNYNPTSEVSAINSAAGGKAVTISRETYAALCMAKKYARLTNGAFDFTVGPLISLWGFNSDQPGLTGPAPDTARIEQVRQLVGYRGLILEEHAFGATARLKHSGMQIDTGAFGKGIAAEQAINNLRKKGVQSALVAAGGTISAIGLKPDNKPWQVGIRHPRNNSSFLTVISLQNQSVSTSGDYEKFYYKAGKRRTHIIDPRTGMPVSTIQSVTVIAPGAFASDALSTALFVLGPDDGLKIIEAHEGIEALLVTASGEVLYSSGWPQKTIIY